MQALTPIDTTNTLLPTQPRRQGFALIITLSLVALCTLMIVGVHMLGSVEMRSATQHLDGSFARHLGHTAVAVATARLADATTQTFSDGAGKPWTSQPGAIRVHDMSGNLQRIHKLYSAARADAATEEELAEDLPGDWQSQPEAYVDLNEPLYNSRIRWRFPIVDPRMRQDLPEQSVEGFDYESFPGTSHSGDDTARLPMPVRWIYVLQDGQFAGIDAMGRLSAEGSVIDPERNPVVGRIAFWVDDESCKVNVNTAAEGAFWDTPRADTQQERYLATHQPSRLEYPRQPGHPAGVCLSSVLLPHRRHYPMGFVAAENGMPTMEPADCAALWKLGRIQAAEPETQLGSSMGGQAATDWSLLWDLTPFEKVRQPRYTSVGEMIFDNQPLPPGVGGAGGSGTASLRRTSAFFDLHPEAVQRLIRSDFFLTASSSAPETTLYGTPRIAMWPVHASAQLNQGNTQLDDIRRDTAYDHKVLLTATHKGRPWFVQRSEPGNGAKDFKTHASGANEALFQHLQRLAARPVPGFYRPQENQTTFAAKYETDCDSILLNMMDYIRGTNFADGHLKANNQFSILCPGVEQHGFGQVAPLQILPKKSLMGTADYPQGQGRFLTVSEVAFVMICRAEVDASGQIQGRPTAANRSLLVKPGDREVEVGVLVEAYVPGQGWADYRPWASVSLVGGPPRSTPDTGAAAPLPLMRLNGQSLLLSTTGAVLESADAPPTGWNVSGGSVGIRSLSEGMLLFRPVVIPGEADGTAPALQFEGGSGTANQLKLAVYDSPSGAGSGRFGTDDLVQVIPLELPDILPVAPLLNPLKVPTLPTDRKIYPLLDRWKDSVRKGSSVLAPNDVVQSLAPIHGDYRLLAGQRWVESARAERGIPVFVPDLHWGRLAQAHSLRDATLSSPTAAQGYVRGLHYQSARSSDLPAALMTVVSGENASVPVRFASGWTRAAFETQMDLLRLDGGKRGSVLPYVTGDFDNGVANMPDGPGTNRPDDGNWAGAKDGKVPYFDAIPVGASVPPVSLATFSAQRLLPSPVKFGSLPTGTRSQVPWQTLLFRPQAQHYGQQSPPDHLLLDLFFSPVLEPEPLSLGFETKGKINLNHPLVPFRYIHRATALHAAMKAEAMMAIPDSAVASYKTGSNPTDRFRKMIDARSTLALMKAKVFDAGRSFLSATELCEHPLIPEGLFPAGTAPTQEAVDEFWQQHRLTGDNSKEQPYAHLYPRLTTRSNSYRVHFIAQSLKKARSVPADQINLRKDQVTATVRGSALIQRHIDPTDARLPDYLAPPQTAALHPPPLDQFATWKVGSIQEER